MRPGDKIIHEPSGEAWGVGAVSPDGTELSPFGWPTSIAKVSDCTLFEAATDDECEKAMSDCRELPPGDIRHLWTPLNDEQKQRKIEVHTRQIVSSYKILKRYAPESIGKLEEWVNENPPK